MHIAAAQNTFRQLGTPPWIKRAAAESNRLGARRSRNATELTPTEEQIAELVASGHSNAEVSTRLSVSLRTVESNLTRVYRKLSVRSRTEMVAVYRRRTDSAST